MLRISIVLIFLLHFQSSFGQVEIKIDKEDYKIYAKTFGEGFPTLIINGGPGMNSEGFAPLAREIGKRNLAIIYDQRGTGRSTLEVTDEHSITLDLMIADIEVLRKKLGIREWVVLGHSFGGMLAAYYATKYPERIRGLIFSSSGGLDMQLFSILNINAKLTSTQQDSLNYWSQKMIQGDTSFQTRLQRGKFLAPAYLYGKSHVPAIAHRLTQLNSRVNQLVFQNMRSIDFDCKEKLKSFKKRVLILQGKQDIIPAQIAEHSKAILPQAEIIFIDQCGHYPWLENPQVYLNEINNFIEKS